MNTTPLKYSLGDKIREALELRGRAEKAKTMLCVWAAKVIDDTFYKAFIQ
jgi:hypothetical protein